MTQLAPPSKHTVAFLTYIGLLPLVYYIPPLVSDLLTGTPIEHKLATTLISVTLIVPLISYFYLPLVLKIVPRFTK